MEKFDLIIVYYSKRHHGNVHGLSKVLEFEIFRR
jgi:hypothetical protein